MKRGDEVKVATENSMLTGEHGRILGPCDGDGRYDWRVRMNNQKHGVLSFTEDELELTSASRA